MLKKFYFSLFLFCVLTLANVLPQTTGWNFDWDDNIFYMPDQIMLTHKTTGKEKGVSTTEYAKIRELVGKAGTEWADYNLGPTGLRFFGDNSEDGSDRFLKSVNQALSKSTEAWKGPSWKAFVIAMSDPRTAETTSIITARQHAPSSIHKALLDLQKKGLIKNVPPENHIFPVGYPKLQPPEFRGASSSPSAAKAKVMLHLLDELNSKPIPANAVKVLNPDGVNEEPMHLWGFSDDDLGNYKTAVDVLSKEALKGRWPHVKITVFFTGKNIPEVPPHSVVLRQTLSAKGESTRPTIEKEKEAVYTNAGLPQGKSCEEALSKI